MKNFFVFLCTGILFVGCSKEEEKNTSSRSFPQEKSHNQKQEQKSEASKKESCEDKSCCKSGPNPEILQPTHTASTDTGASRTWSTSWKEATSKQ